MRREHNVRYLLLNRFLSSDGIGQALKQIGSHGHQLRWGDKCPSDVAAQCTIQDRHLDGFSCISRKGEVGISCIMHESQSDRHMSVIGIMGPPKTVSDPTPHILACLPPIEIALIV